MKKKRKKVLKCAFQNCKTNAKFTWYACADGREGRGICSFHDAFMNVMYLSATRRRNWKKLLKQYIDKL